MEQSIEVNHLAPLIRDLAIILGVAALVTFIFRRIKQPVVLGYIIAGIIVGPYVPGVLSITDIPNIQVWAELGVIFLMFALGLEFSFRKLARVGFPAATTTMIQVTLMMSLGYSFAKYIGWSNLESFYFGCMICISSTTIIIKAFDELGLKSKYFAQLVFGILIVEDLIAILILVGLSSFAESSNLGGLDIITAAAKLAIVVGAWFLVGIFIVPRFLSSFKKYGDNEMLTVLSIGLCLGLVTLSAYFNYSVALGAFIMGSILAETTEAKKIEHLISPLKDVFGAIFFVSVGMMMNPIVFYNSLGLVFTISGLIIVGQIFSLTLGSLTSGQSLYNSIRTSFSMAQIGEFSFIIATVGKTYGVIGEDIFPIIIASSLITTFTTPYLMRFAPTVYGYLDQKLPDHIKNALQSYSTFIQRSQSGSATKKELTQSALRWISNAIIVIIIFLISARPFLISWLQEQGLSFHWAKAISWVFAICLSAPFLWSMTQVFGNLSSISFKDRRAVDLSKRAAAYLSQVLSVILVGTLSLDFFPAWIAVLLTVVVIMMVTFLFKRPLEAFYRWFDYQFQSGFQAHNAEKKSAAVLNELAPWDAHLVSVCVHPNSTLVGKQLLGLQFRERHGLNIVAIKRGTKTIVAPKAADVLLPDDELLFLGTDDEIDSIRQILEKPPREEEEEENVDLSTCRLRSIVVHPGSSLDGSSILASGIREQHGGMVVGIEREGKRIFNPKSTFVIKANDTLLVVGIGPNAELPDFLNN